jgi:ubiquinone/menaquinone biosynthesis C-methylase UbiE
MGLSLSTYAANIIKEKRGRTTMSAFNLNEKTTAFLSAYRLFKEDTVQQVQLQHRLTLVDAFKIEKGMRVLEIGCGQGDTTAALADAVGETGFVVAIDIASPTYGAPLTLKQATDIIKQSSLGERISFHFETDFNTFEIDTPFDVAVLSHCSWYFKRPEALLSYFKKLKTMTKTICFAEWDLDFISMSQRAHFCAASILSLYSIFVENEGNIQNIFSKSQIQQMLEQAGFQNIKPNLVDASYLQDGRWEKAFANEIRAEFKNAPERVQTLITNYYQLMNTSNGEVHSLNSFVFCAD